MSNHYMHSLIFTGYIKVLLVHKTELEHLNMVLDAKFK
jgi:hypothetical protein